ncbi:GDP-mannose-dependent alpha-mannosyltransferase [Pseudovibrio axinellae]|uniref:GDP-mannose-dependent alpha-mannosyltransferase n=1 Tax=Pseudovibrio axinellae TaxID=989403 RepID=A0A165VSP8_9HYPH|nr:glycosyltransferase family 1 protein [Pseudovibrio axinellae]KZL15386.1 GDP-mannose-dependent alpha-mannosyltransferase [Pseudovibrio axinellae]SER54246.1 Glycosyltransferase involved in cell wall bisynthesis [Pseudovibrio axinellae]
MKIVIVSDAWHPQINGVVRVLEITRRELTAMGHDVTLITPDQFPQIPLPTYPDIKLAVTPSRKLARRLRELEPDALHILTEGPLGWAARKFCRRYNYQFTSSWLSKYPEYIAIRTGLSTSWLYKVLAAFHNQAAYTMVTTSNMMETAKEVGIPRVVCWPRGVDLSKFRPVASAEFEGLPKPIMLYVGRIAPEKNLAAFLDLELPGTKILVGDGPDLSALAKRYPSAVFTGSKVGDDLVKAYCGADVMVFPSKTDTFGLVNLEAMACGIPVAAFPVTGPKDIIGTAPVGAVDEDLSEAIKRALPMKAKDCIAHAQTFSWDQATQKFLKNLVAFSAAAP